MYRPFFRKQPSTIKAHNIMKYATLVSLAILYSLMAISCKKKPVGEDIGSEVIVETVATPPGLPDPSKFLLMDSISFDSTYLDFLYKKGHLSAITPDEYKSFSLEKLAFSPKLSNNLYKIDTQGNIKDDYSFIFQVFYENNPSDKKVWLATYDKKNNKLLDNRIIYRYAPRKYNNLKINSYMFFNKSQIKIHHSDFEVFLEDASTYPIKILNTGKFLEFEEEEIKKNEQFAITACNGDIEGKYPLKENWTMIHYAPNTNKLTLSHLTTETYGGGLWAEPSTVSSISTDTISDFLVKGKLSNQDIKILDIRQITKLKDNNEINSLTKKYEMENPDSGVNFGDNDSVFIYRNKLDDSEYYLVQMEQEWGSKFGYLIVKTKEGIYKPIGLSTCFDKIYAIQIKDKQYLIDCGGGGCEGAGYAVSIYDLNNDGKEVYTNSIMCD